MNYKLINRNSNFTKGWELYKDGTLIASTFKTDLPSITFSDEVAKELGIINFNTTFNKFFPNWNNKDILSHSEQAQISAYCDGYNQALSDNKDKLFTLEEIEDAYLNNGRPTKEGFKDYIQSLTKQEYECFGELQGNIFLVTKIIK